jgi:WD40 repeat protein
MSSSARYDVFLSYHWRDQAPVEALAHWLRAQGIQVFLDRWYLVPGQPWPQMLEHVLSRCGAVAVCLGPSGMGPWQQREKYVALDRQAHDPRFPVIPVLLPGADPVPGFLCQNTWVDLRERPDDPVRLAILAGAIRGEPPGPAIQEKVQATLAAICPYRGLLPFREEDAPFFFGRAEAIKRLLQDVANRNLLAVVGASGSGKSSVVRAGLVPALRRDRTPVWEVATLVPGDRPLHALATALVPLLEPEKTDETDRLITVNKQVRALQDGDLQLRDIVERVLQKQPGTDRLLLIVDQWEELYTLTRDDGDRRRFVDELLEATTRAPLAVVLTLRGDFVGHVLAYRPLSDRLQDAQINLGPMTRAELQQAITAPAEQIGLSFEAGLVARILDDVGDEPGNLPLLEFVLKRLWEERHRGLLFHEAYQTMGCLQGAVARKAEEVFGHLSALEQQAVRRVFLQLVRPGEGVEDTRRRARFAEIGEPSWPVVQKLADARLLVTAPSGTASEETVEVSHEALIQNWDRLKAWINEDREFLLWRARLRGLLAEWQHSHEDESILLRGPLLAEAERWLQDRGDQLSSEERDYIGYGSLLREREQQAEQERRERELRQAQALAAAEAQRAEEQAKATRRQRRFFVTAVVVATIFIGLFALASYQQLEVKRANNKVVEVQQLARYTSDIETKPQRSLLLSVRAASLSKNRREGTLVAVDELRQQLRSTGGRPLGGHEKSTRVAAFSFDRHWLATGSDDGGIRLWDLRNADPAASSFLLDGHRGSVSGLAFSPNGQWLVSSGADGAVRLWRLTPAGATPGPVFGGGRFGAIYAVAISPKSDWLAFGTQNGNVCIWKMSAEGLSESPCEIGKEEEPVEKVLFSLKGHWLATVGAEKKRLSLWDLSADFSNQEPARLFRKGHERDYLQAIAFNSDETRLAVAYDYVAEVWDLTQKNPPQHVVASGSHNQWITAVGLSPDNHWLATGSVDTNVKLWDLTGVGQEPILLQGHSATVRSVVFSDDGRWLATAGDDATARLWDLSKPTMPNTLLRGQDLPIERVIFSPGDAKPHYLVTVGQDQHARLWSIPDPTSDPIVLRGHASRITSAAVTSNGEWIASSGENDPRLLLWSTKDPRKPVYELPLAAPSDPRLFRRATAFSPDSRWLASRSEDGVISLWNFADLSKQPIELFEHEGGDVESLGFSPDSRWLVSGTWGGIVNIWDISSDTPSLKPRFSCRQSNPVRGSPAFSLNGRYVATAAHGFNARLWDLNSPDPCASPRLLGPHTDAVTAVAFSPDSRWAATASFDGKGRLWDLRASSEPKLLSELKFKDRVMQAAFSPDNRWVAFGSWDWTIQLLDLKNLGASKPIELAGHAGRVFSVSFSPDSQWLVTAGEDRTIRLWDPTDPSAAPVVLRGHEGSAFQFGFSQDSRWVFTASDDGTVRLWRLKLADLIDIACQTAGRQLTPEEVRDFLGDEDTEMPCVAPPAAKQVLPK